MSAGSKPTGQVHPRLHPLGAKASTTQKVTTTQQVLGQSTSHPISSSPSVPAQPAKSAPLILAQSYVQWGVEDPAHATGTDAEIDAAFMMAYRILRARIEAFWFYH